MIQEESINRNDLRIDIFMTAIEVFEQQFASVLLLRIKQFFNTNNGCRVFPVSCRSQLPRLPLFIMNEWLPIYSITSFILVVLLYIRTMFS